MVPDQEIATKEKQQVQGNESPLKLLATANGATRLYQLEERLAKH